MICLFW